jgi:hypothetical protein
MQLFCSLLTGFFLWLLIFHWRRKSIARLRKLAGDLVVKTKSGRPWKWRLTLLAFLLVGLLSNVGSALMHGRGLNAIGFYFGNAVVFALILILADSLRATIAFEVRANGILCGRRGHSGWTGSPFLTPWNQITAYQWVPESFGCLGRLDDTHGWFTVAEVAIAPEDKNALTAAIGQFVPVYDHDGTLLAKPEQDNVATQHVPWQSLDFPRFQFDLQTLLLAVVVVACVANLFALHYHSPHYQALKRLESLGPNITYFDDDVWRIDFSNCTNKPTDDDLVNLEPIVEIVNLDLSGSPITDAGLTHLKGLKNLCHVNLANTAVTAEGMENLQQALPDKRSVGKWVPAPPSLPAKAPQHP